MDFDMNQELEAYITLDAASLTDDFWEMLGITPPDKKQQDDVQEKQKDDVQEKQKDDLPFSDPNEHVPNGCAMKEIARRMNEHFRLPFMHRVIFSGPATTILWYDGTKTTVKASEGQQYDRYAGFCACVVKKLFGSTSTAKKLMDSCDADLARKAWEAEQEKAREQRRREEEDRRVKKALRHVPSERELRERAYDRALEMVIDRMAIEVSDNIEQRMAARTAKEEAKEQ